MCLVTKKIFPYKAKEDIVVYREYLEEDKLSDNVYLSPIRKNHQNISIYILINLILKQIRI